MGDNVAENFCLKVNNNTLFMYKSCTPNVKCVTIHKNSFVREPK